MVMTVNEKITRAISFYNKFDLSAIDDNPYSKVYCASYGLRGTLKPLFNPLPKIVSTLSVLALRALSLESTTDKDAVTLFKNLFKLGDYNSVLYDILYWLLIAKKAVVEVVKSEVADTYDLVVHDIRKCDIKVDGTKVIYAKFNGFCEEFDKEELKFTTKELVREYFDVDGLQGYREMDKLSDSAPTEKLKDLPCGIIPVAIFSLQDFDIMHLIDIIDEHNQEFYWLKKVFALHGNAPLAAEGVKGAITKADKDSNLDDFTGVNFFQLSEGNLKYVEMTGNVAKLIMTQLDKHEKSVKTDYPEYALVDLINGSAIAEETSKIQLIEVISRVNRVRQSVDQGLQSIYAIIAAFEGKSTPNIINNFGSVLPTSVNELMVVIKALRELALISKTTAIEKVVTTGYINSAEEEIGRLQKEKLWDVLSLSNAGKDSSNSDTSTSPKDNTNIVNEQVGRVSADKSGKRTDKSMEVE